MSDAKLMHSLWIYSIHSNNSDFICNYIEKIDSFDEDTNTINISPIYRESIKCNHNDIANYIMDKYLPDKEKLPCIHFE